MPRNVAGPIARGDDHWGRDAEIDDMRRRLRVGHVLLTLDEFPVMVDAFLQASPS